MRTAFTFAVLMAAIGSVAAQQAQSQPTPPAAPVPPAAPAPRASVAKSISTLKPDEQKKFQDSIKQTGINPTTIQGMDLETAMMAVQSERAKLLENSLKDQIAAVQARNESISKMSQAVGALNKAAATFGPSDKGDKKFGANLALEKEVNTALEAAKLKPVVMVAGSDPGSARGLTSANAIYEGGISSTTSKAQIETAIRQVQSVIDGANNSQQMDMLRLQSLSNKRNEAFQTMTNFIKKMQESRSSVVGNMR